MKNLNLSIDFETVSTADLRKIGAWAYAAHPSTRVIIMAYAFGNKPVQVWVPGQPFPEDVEEHVLDNYYVHAWNCNFEIAIWTHVLSRVVPDLVSIDPRQCRCTMAAAAYSGLPLSLDLAAPALGLGVAKDRKGHDLMMRMTRPRAYDALGAPRWWHEEDQAKYVALQNYAMQDVVVERAIANAIPALPEYEKPIWEMDHAMNRRGIMVDRDLIDTLDVYSKNETARLDAEMRSLTGSAVPNTRSLAALQRWLVSEGVQTPSLDKAHMKALLDDPTLAPLTRKVLETRAEAAKTSTAKLTSMTRAAGTDDRVRGLVQYHGAGRTGRWAGRLCQVQNYPRPPSKYFNAHRVIHDFENGEDPSTIELVHGPVLTAISGALRGCFIPKPGHKLVAVDFEQVEARVIAWLAGAQDILDVFMSGQDIYIYTAAQIGSTNRQLGKVIVLALGFGMGPDKFVETAKGYGITLDPDEARSIVYDWRDRNYRIRNFWYELGDIATEVIESGYDGDFIMNRGTNRIGFRMGRNKLRGSLLMRLPSGRYLCYREARLVDGSITYKGVNQYTRKWSDIRTYGGKLAENATQAVARDLLAEAMLTISQKGFPLVASIHDEAVVEVSANEAGLALSTMQGIMRSPPTWAPGLPLGGAGYIGDRYGK
jgi:DNA polymerase